MSSMPLLLDTNIISHLMLDATGAAAAHVVQAQDAGQKVVTSVVVQCELQLGLARASGALIVGPRCADTPMC